MSRERTASLLKFFCVGLFGLVFLMTGSSFAACPDGMIAYWKLDETTPGTYEDFLNGKDGTGNANPTPAAGIVGGAQEFNGTDTGIAVPAHPSFGWYRDQLFSIEFWVKRDDAVLVTGDPEVVIGRFESASTLRWWVGITNTQVVQFQLTATNNTQRIVTGTTNVVDGEWHHVVAMRVSGEIRLYVDGVLDGSTAAVFGAGFESTSADLTIGFYNADFYLDGLVDEVALYDRALPLDEIEDHYDAGLLGRGIDYVASDPDDDTPSKKSGGGGGGGGCFVSAISAPR